MDENKELKEFYEKYANKENFATPEEYWENAKEDDYHKREAFEVMNRDGMFDSEITYADWNASRFGVVKKKDTPQQIASEDSISTSEDSELGSGETDVDEKGPVDVFEFDDEEYVNEGGFQDKTASSSELYKDILGAHNNWNQHLESIGVTDVNDINFAGVVDSDVLNEDYYNQLIGTEIPEANTEYPSSWYDVHKEDGKRKQGRNSKALTDERWQLMKELIEAQNNNGLTSAGKQIWEKTSDIPPGSYQPASMIGDKFAILNNNLKKKFTPEGQKYLDRLREINEQLDFDNKEAIQANFNYNKALFNSVNRKPDNFSNSSDAFVLNDELSNGMDNINFNYEPVTPDSLYSPKLFVNLLTGGQVDEETLSGIQQTTAIQRAISSHGALIQAKTELENSGQPVTEEALKALVAVKLDENEMYTRRFFENDDVFKKWFQTKDKEDAIIKNIQKLESELQNETDPERINKITNALSKKNGELEVLQQEYESLSKKSSMLDMSMMFDYNGGRVDKNIVNQSLESKDPQVLGPSQMLYQFNSDVANKISEFTNILDESKDAHELLNIYHGLVDADKYYAGLLDDYKISLTPGTWRKRIPGFSRKAYEFYLKNVKNNKDAGSTFNFMGTDYETELFNQINAANPKETFYVKDRENAINDDEIWLNKMSLRDAFDLFGAPKVDAFLGKKEIGKTTEETADESEKGLKAHNIDNRILGANNHKYVNDGLERRVDRLKEYWLKNAVENRANLRAIAQVLHFNTDPGSVERGGFLNYKLFGEGFAEGLVNLPIDASNYVRRNLGAEEIERYDYGSVADFQTAYLEAANNVGYDVTENQIEQGMNSITESTVYGVSHMLPAIGLQQTLLFPLASMGGVYTLGGLGRLYGNVRKSMGFSTNLKKIYSSEQLTGLGIGKGLKTFEQALAEQKSIAHSYNLMRQWSYAQGDVGKIMWNLGESSAMTGLTFQLTPGEHFSPEMGAGLGFGSTLFRTMFPMTKSGEQIYKNFINGKSTNSFVPGKAQVAAINWIGETSSGTFAMYTGELAEHWIGHGIPFREAVAQTIGKSGDEQVDKLIAAVMFASSFSTMHSAAFVSKGKETIMKDIVMGAYPENIKSYARKALSSLEFYESAPGGSLLREMMNNNVSLRELLESDKFSFAFPELKEDIIRYKNNKELENDLSNRLHGENPETFSILSAHNPMGKKLSEQENASRNAQLKAEIEKMGYKIQETQIVNPDGSVAKAFYVPSLDAKVASHLARTYGQEYVLSDGGKYFISGPNQGQMFKTNGELHVSDGFTNNYITMPVGNKTSKVRFGFENNLSPVEFNYGIPKASLIKSEDFKWDKNTKEYNYTIEPGDGANPAIQLTLKRNKNGEFVLSGKNIEIKDIEGPLGVADKNAAVSKVKELVRSNFEKRIKSEFESSAPPVEFEFNKESSNKEQVKEHNENSNSMHNDSKGSLRGSSNYAINNLFPERNITIKSGEKVTDKHIRDFKEKNADVLRNQNFAVSTRIDKTGDTVLEIVGLVGNKNLEYAKELARNLNLPEIVDMANGKSIKTGLTKDSKLKLSRDEMLDAFTEVENNSMQKNLSLKLIDKAISSIEGSPEMTGESLARRDFPNAIKNILMESKKKIMDGMSPREAAENAVESLLAMTETINKKIIEAGGEPVVITPYEMAGMRNMILGPRDFKSSISSNVGSDGIVRTSEVEMQNIMNEKTQVNPEAKTTGEGPDLVKSLNLNPKEFIEYVNRQQALDAYSSHVRGNLVHDNSPIENLSISAKELMFDSKMKFKQRLKNMVNAKINEDFARLPENVRSELAESAYNSIIQLENSATAAHITKLKLDPILREIYGGVGRDHLGREGEIFFNSIVKLRTNISNWRVQDSRKLEVDNLVEQLNSAQNKLNQISNKEYKNPETKNQKMSEIKEQINNLLKDAETKSKKISLGDNVIQVKMGEDGKYAMFAKIKGVEGERILNKGVGEDVIKINGEGQYPWQIKNTAVMVGGKPVYPDLVNMKMNLTELINRFNEKSGKDAFAENISPRVEKLREFYKAQTEYMYNEGLISSELKNELQSRDFYSPKLYIQHIRNYQQENPRVTGKDNWGSPIKTLSDGSGQIQSQNQHSLLTNYQLGLENKVQKNRLYRNIHDYISKLENTTGFSGVDFGFKIGDGQTVKSKIDQINAYRKAKNLPEILKDNYVETYYLKDGKEQNFMLSKEMFDNLNNKHSQEIFGKPGAIENTAGYFTNIFKSLKTGINPFFAAKNFPRDIMHTMMYTDYYSPILPIAGLQMGKDFMATAKGAWGVKNMNNKLYYDYVLNGGGMEFYSLMGADAKNPLSLGYEVKPGVGFRGKAREYLEKTFNPIRTMGPTSRLAKIKAAGIQGLQYFGQTSEVWVRMAVTHRMTNQYVTEATKDSGITRAKGETIESFAKRAGLSEQQILNIRRRAVNDARNTIDFSQSGSVGSRLNTIIPYSNAALQGFRISARAMRDRPLSTGFKAMQLVGLGMAIERNLIEDHGEWYEDQRRKNPYKFMQYHFIPNGMTDENGDPVFSKIAKDHSSMVFYTLGSGIMRNIKYGEKVWDDESFWNNFNTFASEGEKTELLKAFEIGWLDPINPISMLKDNGNPLYNAFEGYITNQDKIGRRFSPLFGTGGSTEQEFERGKTPNFMIDLAGNYNKLVGDDLKISPDRSMGFLHGLGFNKEHFTVGGVETMYDKIMGYLSPEEKKELYNIQKNDLERMFGKTLLKTIMHIPSLHDSKSVTPYSSEWRERESKREAYKDLENKKRQVIKTGSEMLKIGFQQFKDGDEDAIEFSIEKAMDYIGQAYGGLVDEGLISSSEAEGHIKMLRNDLKKTGKQIKLNYDGTQSYISNLKVSNPKEAAERYIHHIEYWKGVVDGTVDILPEDIHAYPDKESRVKKLSQVINFSKEEVVKGTKFSNAILDILSGEAQDPDKEINKINEIMKDLHKSK